MVYSNLDNGRQTLSTVDGGRPLGLVNDEPII